MVNSTIGLKRTAAVTSGLWGRVLRSLHVWSGEGRPTFIFVVYIFLFTLGFTVLNVGRMTLFLSRIGIEWLPYMYGLNVAAIIPLRYVYSRVSKHLNPVRLAMWSYILAAVSNIGLALIDMQWTFVFIYVWVQVQVTFGDVQLWNLADDTFHARQAKRLYPILLVGSSVGRLSVLGMRPVIDSLGDEAIIWVGSGIVVLCVPVDFDDWSIHGLLVEESRESQGY